MLGIFGLFLQAAAGHILYLALHLESGSFPRPLPPDRERAAFADLQKGGAAAAQARDTLIRHNLRPVAITGLLRSAVEGGVLGDVRPGRRTHQ